MYNLNPDILFQNPIPGYLILGRFRLNLTLLQYEVLEKLVTYIRIERTSLYLTGLKTIFYYILQTISQSAQEMWQFVRSDEERRVNVKVEGKWINSETKTKYLIKLNKNNTQPSTEIQISFVLILTIKIKQVNNLNFDQRSKFQLVRPYNHSMCRS